MRTTDSEVTTESPGSQMRPNQKIAFYPIYKVLSVGKNRNLHHFASLAFLQIHNYKLTCCLLYRIPIIYLKFDDK